MSKELIGSHSVHETLVRQTQIDAARIEELERERDTAWAQAHRLALELEVKRDIAVSTLEKVKADRSVAMKALAAQCDETKKLRAELATARKVRVTLTGKEIRDLAELAGLQFVEHDYADEYETEITIETPSGFLLNDDGVEEHYSLIAYLTEYPEEGAIGLGDVLPAVQEPQINLEGYREAGSSLAGDDGGSRAWSED